MAEAFSAGDICRHPSTCRRSMSAAVSANASPHAERDVARDTLLPVVQRGVRFDMQRITSRRDFFQREVWRERVDAHLLRLLQRLPLEDVRAEDAAAVVAQRNAEGDGVRLLAVLVSFGKQ